MIKSSETKTKDMKLHSRRGFKLEEVDHFICQNCLQAITYRLKETCTNEHYFCKECGDCTHCGDTFFDDCIGFSYCHCKICVKQKGCKVFI